MAEAPGAMAEAAAVAGVAVAAAGAGAGAGASTPRSTGTRMRTRTTREATSRASYADSIGITGTGGLLSCGSCEPLYVLYFSICPGARGRSLEAPTKLYYHTSPARISVRISELKLSPDLRTISGLDLGRGAYERSVRVELMTSLKLNRLLS